MNFTLDTLTVSICSIIIALAVITPFLTPFFRMRKMVNALHETPAEKGGTPPAPMTVLVTVQHNQAKKLQEILPTLLEQEYEPGFEVVVVAEKGDSETEDVLNLFARNENLYITYIPDSSRYMSRKKLSITLGVKAAHHEWILMTDANCRPNSRHWLEKMASGCDEGHQLVIGYSNYDDEAKAFYRFYRLGKACYTLREAKYSTAYCSAGSNIAFRKSEFISQDGFRGNLQFIRGEYDFLVNKHAQKRKSSVVIEQDAWTIENPPTQKEWIGNNLSYLNIRKHLKRNFRHRLLPVIDQTALHFTFITIMSSLAASAFMENWILTGVAGIALCYTCVVRSVIAKKILKTFGENITSWHIYPYELGVSWHSLALRIRYRRTDKYIFTTHKV